MENFDFHGGLLQTSNKRTANPILDRQRGMRPANPIFKAALP